MARSLDQISADLDKLDSSTQDLDQTLQTVYQNYLNVVGLAVKRQLVLATYHLCTQTYPEEFVALTVPQREKLQSDLRQLAAQGEAHINQLGQIKNVTDLAAQLEDVVAAKYAAMPSEDDGDDDEDLVQDQTLDNPSSSDLPPMPEISAASSPVFPEAESSVEAALVDDDSIETSPTETNEQSDSAPSSDEAATMLQRLSTSLSLFSLLEAEPLTPVSLAKRHVLLERHLRAILRTLSSLANHLLKQANVLPDLPDMVIAAATEADGDGTGTSQPNLVSVLVELADRRDDSRDDDEDEVIEDNEEDFSSDEEPEHEMTHLVAINLRLADVEFADTQAALWRGRLQEMLHKLKRLGRQYRTLRQEQARAEAEHAWRAVWFED